MVEYLVLYTNIIIIYAQIPNSKIYSFMSNYSVFQEHNKYMFSPLT